MNWRKRKKELDKEYEYFWNNITTNGIDSKKDEIEKVVIVGFPPKEKKGIDALSIEKAIKWRNQSNELPEDLT